LNNELDLQEMRLRREALYELLYEYIQDLLVLSRSPAERKAIGFVFYLLYFVQGKRRLPRKDEFDEVVADCLDRNLGKDDFSTKWQLDLKVDQAVDNPEKFYLETLQKLQLLQVIRDGWGDWLDGDLSASEKRAISREKLSRLQAHLKALLEARQ
jgi:hypothetical protein